MRKYGLIWWILAGAFSLGILISGCVGDSSPVEDPGVDAAEEGEAGSIEEVDLGPKDYGVPAEDASVVNPVAADDASLEQGEKTYKNTCLKCHGEEGRGDGPSATNPTDFRAEFVKELSDGELFYIITNGIEGSDMQGWAFLDEEKRWNLVNYIRTLQEID